MDITIRPARFRAPEETGEDDAEAVRRLVRALAQVQEAADYVTGSVDDLRRDGSGERPYFRAMIAERADGTAVGLAVYYFVYSTWAGRPKLYVEDLYVDGDLRGTGLGRRLMASLARVAIDHGCVKLDLSVKTDNKARDFYSRLGLTRSGTWLPYTVGGSDLESLASSG
ncbi:MULTISPECIES: GNAT family N-acetyltransferase [Thalassobaculum]|uniref:Acetyltransferase (GNAT) family protein n=1 Tax=Thalassobaculum litoreum DSM 18839 TaxID=1123362 RepID=A0A8G2BJ57_9PROT|nr:MULTISPECIES: GNAT family N-acetyltransferase [Thalassobaculum]SDF56188.1 Acetyltransferase (GNAT) family protein [Thalassobaculum litoreum DSM 18839]